MARSTDTFEAVAFDTVAPDDPDFLRQLCSACCGTR